MTNPIECTECKKQFDLEVGGHQDEGGEWCEACWFAYMEEMRAMYGSPPPRNKHDEDICDAYDLDDPKHPGYMERMSHMADVYSKERRER